MKQVKIDNVLYVLSIVPYQITQDTSVETIYINCNYLDEFKELNPDLELVPYNYRLLRKSQPPYMPYVDVPDFVDFEFDSSIQNVSSMVDETKTMTLQELHLPDDYTGTVTYKLDGVLLDSSIFTLYDASLYEVLAEIPGTSLYEQDTASYQIIYSKDKYNAEISFAQSTVNVSSYVDSSYTGNIQQVSNAPENVNIKYYLNNSLLDSSVINLTEAGQYQVKAAIVSDELYNDTSTSYQINYSKVKRDVILSFADSSVNITVEDDTTYSGQVQNVVGLPTGVTANYYLGNTLLSNGQIEISDLQEGENTFTITAKIENDSVYNDAQASYTLNVTMEISSYENKYFTLEPLEDGTIKFTTNNLQYSTDRGTTWNTLTANTSLGVTNGNNVMFKCENPTSNTTDGIGKFSSSGQFNIFGNLLSLKYGDNFNSQTTITLNNCQFKRLFYQSKIVNAENLILPATTLSFQCYIEMFYGCTTLVTAPKILPATTLENACYDSMFVNCSSLTIAPELPATTLVGTMMGYYCYAKMFISCTSLNYIKAACPPNSERAKPNWVQNVAATGTYVISDPNYNINDGVIIGVSSIPTGWIIKDYQGNTINPKIISSFNNSNSLSNNTYLNIQFAIPSYQITTNPAAALSEVVYSYSTDNTNWTSIPQYLDTTTLGTFTYYIKAEISNSATYVDKSQVYTYTYIVKQPITDFSNYVCLNDISDVSSLLDTSVLQFNDFIMDLSETLSITNNVYVQLRDTVTNQTNDSYNGIRTFSATGQSDFNLRENRNNYKIQNVGSPVEGHTGYYGYHFTNTMQIFNIQSAVNRTKVYFKLPNYSTGPELYWAGFICDWGMEGWGDPVYGVRVPTDTQIIDQTQDQYVEFSPYRIFYQASTGYFYKQTLVNGSVDSEEQLVAEDGYYTTMFGGAYYVCSGTSYQALEEEDWNDDGEINMERRAPFTFDYALDYDPNGEYQEEEPVI